MLGYLAVGRLILCAGLAVMAGCASAPRAPTADAAGAEAPQYRVGPGDQLSVFVFNHGNLSGDFTVRPDGLLSTPLVEDIMATGKTPTQLARDIEAKLSEFVRSPKVSVIVRTFVGSYADQIRVVGQAAYPQSVPYRASMTVLDVMILVGGLKEFAAGNRAHIVRQVDGKEQTIRVRLDDLLNSGDMNANLPMRPGDVLIIPEARF
jgi:polysaccharide export outer membrane protein